MAQTIPYKTYLNEEEMPRTWYNLKAVMKAKHAPFLNPKTLQPCTREELCKVFCEECVDQELNDRDERIEIPAGIAEFYRMFRPSPLVRAYFLERMLDTPAEIYYKFEGNNTSGSHKLNSAAAQAYYAKRQGLVSITTETGAGQWGTALAMAAAFYGLKLDVFMVKVSYEQKPYRREVMRTYGANVVASPVGYHGRGQENPRKVSRYGRFARLRDLGGSGKSALCRSLPIRSGERARSRRASSVRHRAGDENRARPLRHYAGSRHRLHGRGLQLRRADRSLYGGQAEGEKRHAFYRRGARELPSLTRGKFAYDFCDSARTTPLAKMYTLGCEFMPAPGHAGGLRYHGMSPILSQLYHDGMLEARAVGQKAVFDAAVAFARCEGILPAPESAHAIKVAMDEAAACRESGKKKRILFGLTGTGYFDLSAYAAYNDGALSDESFTEEALERGFASIPNVNL